MTVAHLSSSSAVKSPKTLLAKAGHRVSTDGEFGPHTGAAVRAPIPIAQAILESSSPARCDHGRLLKSDQPPGNKILR